MKYIIALALTLCSLNSFAATCVVTEHLGLPIDRNGNAIQVPIYPTLTTPQAVTYTTSTAVGTAFQTLTRYVGFICSAKAHFEVAPSGTASATASDPWVPADVWLFINVPGGFEIAFYDGTS